MIYKSHIKLFLFFFAAFWLSSCDELNVKDEFDRKLGYEYGDYEKMIVDNKAKAKALKEKQQAPKMVPTVPKLSQIITRPKLPAIAEDKIVSISVTETVPIKDVLVELSRSAEVDVEIDPAITGGIIFQAKNKPFIEVIDRISNQVNLRYAVDDGILKIERDSPYAVNYPVDFLNIVRSASSNMSVTTSLSSEGGGGGDSGSSEGGGGGGSITAPSIGSGSGTAITASYEGDIWSNIRTDLTTILQGSANAVTASASPNAIPVAPSSLTFNLQASVISAFATEKEHKRIRSYLSKVRETLSSQVLIEAKFVEITLDEKYRTGINWQKIDPFRWGLEGTFNSSIANLSNDSITDFVKFGKFSKTGTNFSDTNLETLVTLVETFGTTRTLSSPRLHAINNQQAVLSFVRNEVFFTLEVQSDTETTAANTNTSTTVNSTLNSVPIGVILSLQPIISQETNEVTMNIRPTISRVVDRVTDPAVSFAVAQEDGIALGDVQSQIPVVEVKELDSIMRLKSGDVMVIGGLMEERQSNADSGAPFIMQIPIIGNLFKSVSKTTEIIQTVIFIKATVIPNDYLNEVDKQFYNDFYQKRDPYPFNLIESSE